MQVSNSTGRNTDYRVNASGGAGGSNVCFSTGSADSSTATMVGGLLNPGATELCLSSWPCTVEFIVDGKVISQMFSEDPGLVALVETNGQYAIVTTPNADDGSVAA